MTKKDEQKAQREEILRKVQELYSEAELQTMHEEVLRQRRERHEYERQQMILAGRSADDIRLLDMRESTFPPSTLEEFKILVYRHEQEKRQRQQRKDAILRGELPRRIQRSFGEAIIEHDDPVLNDESLE